MTVEAQRGRGLHRARGIPASRASSALLAEYCSTAVNAREIGSHKSQDDKIQRRSTRLDPVLCGVAGAVLAASVALGLMGIGVLSQGPE